MRRMRLPFRSRHRLNPRVSISEAVRQRSSTPLPERLAVKERNVTASGCGCRTCENSDVLLAGSVAVALT